MTSLAVSRPAPRARLTTEHAQLLARVAARTSDLLTAAAGDRWPERELRALTRCLRTDVLVQAAEEEAQLFPAGRARPGFARLGRDHIRLRAGTAALCRAASGEGTRSPAQLAATARGLLSQLERHLIAEEALLAAAGAAA